MLFGTRFPNYLQRDKMDCGPACVKIITAYYGVDTTWDNIQKMSGLKKEGTSFFGLSKSLEYYGIDTTAITSDLLELINNLPLPLIAHWQGNHFVVVYKVTRKSIYVSDPALGLVRYSLRDFKQHWAPEGKGVVLLLEQKIKFRGNGEVDRTNGLGFLWAYLRPLKKYMGSWILGLALAFAVQMALPFLTQSLVDKGIAYHDLGFVHLVVIAYAFLWIIRWASELLRDWFTLYLSTQIQIQMVTDFLSRLLVLPMAFFETKTTLGFSIG